jgi:antitoxin component YwqK of YwqJK toxin-antitoxin module
MKNLLPLVLLSFCFNLTAQDRFNKDDVFVKRRTCYSVKDSSLITGIVEYYHSNGQKKEEISYKEGIKHGHYKAWDEEGHIKSEKNYKNKSRHGAFRDWHKVKYGVKPNTLKKEMFYKDNEKDSTYTSWFGNGNIKEQQQYDMGLRIGVFKRYHSNGQLFSEVHFDSTGQQNGPSNAWYPDGQMMNKMTMVNGTPEGLSQEWYEDGQLKNEMTYKLGKFHGELKRWNKEGEILYETTFDNGTGINKTFSSNDKIMHEGSLVEGMKDGVHKYWYDNGKLTSEENYVNGSREGTFKSWDKDGNLTGERNYLNGKKHGIWKSWSKDGTLEFEEEYSNNRKVRK